MQAAQVSKLELKSFPMSPKQSLVVGPWVLEIFGTSTLSISNPIPPSYPFLFPCTSMSPGLCHVGPFRSGNQHDDHRSHSRPRVAGRVLHHVVPLTICGILLDPLGHAADAKRSGLDFKVLRARQTSID